MGNATLKRRILKSVILVIMAAGTAGTSGLLASGAGYAVTTAPVHAAARATVAAPAGFGHCATPGGHATPCWATTQNAHDGGPYGCNYPAGVPLFPRAGGLNCLGGNDFVEITCYYQGSPTVNGDGYQDHVDAEDNGSTLIVGHIPDFFVNLGGNYPPAVGIPACPTA